MKVLFDANWLAGYVPGSFMHGGLRVTYELAKRLSIKQDPEVNFTFPELHVKRYHQLRNLLKDEFGANGAKVITNDSPAVQAYFKIANAFNTHRGLGFIQKKYPVLRESQICEYDIYHSPVEAFPDSIKQNRKIKKYLTALDLIALVRPDLAYSGFNQQLFDIYQSIDAETTVLAISQSTKNDLLNYRNDIKEENVIVTYIAADKEIFRPAKKNEQTSVTLQKYNVESGNYFFTLSAVAKFKNTGHIIKSFLEFTEATKNTSVKLLLVGRSRDRQYGTDIFEMYRNHPQLVFADFIPEYELSTIYSNCIAFVYMSLYEGFGLPIVEAMQCGAPVICSNTSSMPEVIGDAGICIDPTDTNALCDALSLVINDKAKCEDYRQRGLERAELFSWDKYADDVVKAYNRSS